MIRLGPALPGRDGPNNWNASLWQESFEWYTYKCRQTGPTLIFGINQTQYKQNSDDNDDDDDDDYDDDDVSMMMVVVVILNMYFVL